MNPVGLREDNSSSDLMDRGCTNEKPYQKTFNISNNNYNGYHMNFGGKIMA